MTNELNIESWVEQAESTKIGRHLKAVKRVERITMVVFAIEGQRYALPITAVKEVVQTPYITSLPQSPKHLLGVCNIRGEVVAVIDTQWRITKSFTLEKSGFVIVLKDDEVSAGLMIQEMPETIMIDVDQIDRNAEVIQAIDLKNRFIEGIFKNEKQMIFLINPQNFI